MTQLGYPATQPIRSSKPSHSQVPSLSTQVGDTFPKITIQHINYINFKPSQHGFIISNKLFIEWYCTYFVEFIKSCLYKFCNQVCPEMFKNYGDGKSNMKEKKEKKIRLPTFEYVKYSVKDLIKLRISGTSSSDFSYVLSNISLKSVAFRGFWWVTRSILFRMMIYVLYKKVRKSSSCLFN